MQNRYSPPHHGAIGYMEVGIGFPEHELLDQKLLDIGGMSDAPGAIVDIVEFPLDEVVSIHFVKESVAWV